ncbi:heterokaryon incompatibility protein-domain-containing protein [Pisolithus croceorrhizus]|nr:heterokaryon incompatibility protein-domain-containing protein [Pisolithus croceorrhizus]
MKLLDVEVVLNIRNKGIQQTRHKPEVMKEFDDAPAPYAILSHRWEEPEVKYEEMIGFTKMEEEERKEVEGRPGYQKIIKSCEQAVEDGHKWLWVDTCCIDKRSSSEQSEAINSMYRWYQNAQVCYVYLNDVESTFPAEQDRIKFPKSNGWPEWFMRGWTLQELIAPKTVKFFNKDWKYIDNKCQLASTMKRITGIPHDVLTSGLAEDRLSVAQIMSWAARRVTTREEDRAYSLMGLFRVNMPMVYGEGKKAFQRLQREIIRVSTDQSIFAWSLQIPRTGSVLAEDPSDFWDCGEVKKMEPSVFVDKLWEYTASRGLSEPSRNKIAGREQHWRKLVAWLRGVDSQEFHTFTVSNVGIQVFLPVVPSRDSPSHCKAILACTRDSDLVTIDLVSSGRSFARTSINFLLPATYPEFKTLHLIHHQDANETRRQVALDDEYASYHGFTRRGTYPREFTDNTVTLSSLVDDLIVIVYANDNVGAWFAIGLGYYLGQEWVHVDGDGRSPTEEKGWEDVDRKAYNRMWKARTTHAMSTFNSKDSDVPPEGHFIKHVHLSQSIWAVRVIWGRWEADNSKIIVDVMQCPGCCVGPCSVTNISRDCSGLGTPGLTEDAVFGPYSLELDGRPVRLWKCSGQRIVLGDYGDYSDGELVRTGNIFEDMRTLGSDRGDSTNWRAVHPVSGPWRPDWMKNQDDLAMAYHSTSEKCLVLRQPQALSLSANEHVSRLLKDLSSRLEEKRLVTTVIQCTDFYTVDDNGKRRDSGDDSAPDNGNYPTEAGMSTLFYIIARPRVWRREPLCKQRQERFKSIRENFLALVDMNQPTGTEPSHSFAVRWTTEWRS